MINDMNLFERERIQYEEKLRVFSEGVERILSFSKGFELDEIKKPLERLSSFVEESKKDILIPLEIFKQEISPAEAICKYLKENKKLKFSEIAKVINRDERTVWGNYRNAKDKKKEKIKVNRKGVCVSVEIFNNKELSILESVVKHLKDEGISNNEIGEMLDKSSSNIWTLNNRAKKKLKS